MLRTCNDQPTLWESILPEELLRLPAELARDLLATSKGRLWWRRLYAAPVGGPLVGGDPHRRHFDSHLER